MFYVVVYLHLSRSSDEHHRFLSCLGTGMRVGKQNTFVIIVHLWTFASAALSVCLLVKRLQYHDTATSGKDSETGDPQLVAEPRVENTWLGNGKESTRTQHWDHGSTRISLRASQRQHWRHRDVRLWQATTSVQKNRRVAGFCYSSKARAGLQQMLSWTRRWCRTTVST